MLIEGMPACVRLHTPISN